MSIQLNSQGATEAAAADPPFAQRSEAVSRSTRATQAAPRRAGAEVYDALLWRLNPRLKVTDGCGFLVGLTGCSRRAGVTTLAANLAIRAADNRLGPVLLVDANYQQPALGQLLRAEHRLGVADVLAGRTQLDACLHTTQAEGLTFLPIGGIGRPSRVRVGSPRVDSVVAELRERFALVICDLPEAQALDGAAPLATVLDAALLVVRSERDCRQPAQDAVRSLAAAGVPLMGAVLTDKQQHIPPWFDKWL